MPTPNQKHPGWSCRRAAAITGMMIALSVKSVALAGTYHVSPHGDDANPGTEMKPWQTLRKAAATLVAGDTAVFEDGRYTETQPVTPAHSGEAGKPMVFRSRNKHKAQWYFKGIKNSGYDGSTGAIALFWCKSNSYVTVQDFEITQHESNFDLAQGGRAEKGNFGVAFYWGSDHCRLVGNRIHHSSEDAIKGYKIKGLIVEDNIVHDIGFDAIDFVDVASVTVRNNLLINPRGNGILVKGGSRDVLIHGNRIIVNETIRYQNYFHDRPQHGLSVGISLGGYTAGQFGYDPAGSEAYNCAAWNNLIVCRKPGVIQSAFELTGARDCAAFNNIVAGATTALRATRRSAGNGWTVTAQVEGGRFFNNMVLDCANAVNSDTKTGLRAEHNLYWQTPPPAQEAGSVSGKDPLLVNPTVDVDPKQGIFNTGNWRLQPNSPAIDAGVEARFAGFTNQEIEVSRDAAGTKRKQPWDIGIHEADN